MQGVDRRATEMREDKKLTLVLEFTFIRRKNQRAGVDDGMLIYQQEGERGSELRKWGFVELIFNEYF